MRTIGKFVCICLIIFLSGSCKKQSVQLSVSANDLFWVTNQGADMPVWVKGNTRSNVIILVIHGGPGDGAYSFSDFETEKLRENYSVAFWDQRNAGASSGNSNISSLSLPQMVSDLEALIHVLKYRYPYAGIFLYAHSFGGLLASAYLVKGNNQLQIKGFIDIDGAHNYPLCNSLSRKMLIDTGTLQINKGIYKPEWEGIVNYCTNNDPASSYFVSNQIESFAHKAESYMGIHSSTQNNLFTPEDPSGNLSNYFKLYYTTSGNNFNQGLEQANYSGQLHIVITPSLLLWGKYDFTVPLGVAEDAMSQLSSSWKKLVILPNSGHRPMLEDPDLVQIEIIQFIELFR